jgi:hypothetical protein
MNPTKCEKKKSCKLVVIKHTRKHNKHHPKKHHKHSSSSSSHSH